MGRYGRTLPLQTPALSTPNGKPHNVPTARTNRRSSLFNRSTLSSCTSCFAKKSPHAPFLQPILQLEIGDRTKVTGIDETFIQVADGNTADLLYGLKFSEPSSAELFRYKIEQAVGMHHEGKGVGRDEKLVIFQLPMFLSKTICLRRSFPSSLVRLSPAFLRLHLRGQRVSRWEGEVFTCELTVLEQGRQICQGHSQGMDFNLRQAVVVVLLVALLRLLLLLLLLVLVLVALLFKEYLYSQDHLLVYMYKDFS